MRNLLFGFGILVAGCGSGGSASAPKLPAASGAPVAFVGIDTSGSAREFETAFLRAVRDVDESVPPNGTLEIYRFDTVTHEIHVGPPLDAKPLRTSLQAAIAQDRGQKGTSILSLAQRIDERLPLYPGRPVDILVCTDCGVELMTEKQHKALIEIAGRWASDARVRKVRIVGLRPMHHDTLRRDFKPLEGRLEIN